MGYKHLLHISLFACTLCALAICLHSCSISYKFNGASIDYAKTKSISIAEFPNNAALVYAQLSTDLSQGIRDMYQRNTRLEILRKGGDMEVEGEITGYTLTPMSISADSYSAETKLTMTVKVHFTNNINPEESFDKTYSVFQTFDSSQMLNDVQEDLCAAMITEVAESIYNDTVARW
ncbi:MAG: LPS assembly lipoprotein LptE [Paludibacteraceae bacterium]|nr:LPS assembly lipoprotein LptE [Paludibacteraceae bacterium]